MLDEKQKNKLLSYYKTRYEGHFSPAMLDFHVERLYNQAVKTYDPNKSQFQTHLATYMNKMSRAAQAKGGLIKTTEYSKGIENKIINTYKEMKTYKHITPTTYDIAKKLKIPESKVKSVLENNQHVAIVHGVDTSKIDINPKDLLHGLSKEEEKVLHTISQNMTPEKAYKYTGLPKTTYYSKRKELQDKMKQAYIKTLRDYGGIDNS